MEVLPNKKINSTRTVELSRKLLESCGISGELVSENRPQFVSEEIKIFLDMNWVKHIRTIPYHPPSNGAAEIAVETFKKG